MKNIILTFTLLVISSACFAQFLSKDREALKVQIIKDFEQVFILDSIGQNVLSECTIKYMESHFPITGKPTVDSVNVWYAKSRLSCVAENKLQLQNCFTKWSAFSHMNEGTIKMFESFVPVLKKVRHEDKTILINEILNVFKLNYPQGLPFNVPSAKLNDMLNQLQIKARQNPRLKKYL